MLIITKSINTLIAR